MNKKQLIGLVVAALVFVFVCASSILTNRAAESLYEPPSFLDALSETGEGFDLPTQDFIGVVDVQGTIMGSTDSLSLEGETYNHDKTLELIDALIDSSDNTGILLTVNSPGGTVYESDELYLKLKEYKEETNRPIWTYMETEACSGGYYIAMASDNIVANRNAQTGSIGVIMGLYNYKELQEKIGIKEIYFSSGPNKTMGAASLDLTQEQSNMIQSMVDESYEQFVGIVADGRNMDINTVKPIADGRIYTAQQALDVDLIDSIDTYENTVEAFQTETNDSILFEPESDTSVLESLFSSAMDLQPRSDAEIMTQFLEKQGNGVPMYYANPGQY